MNLCFIVALTALSNAPLAKLNAQTVDFEDIPLEAESASIGPAPNATEQSVPGDGIERAGTFFSGGIEFFNVHTEFPNFVSWSGFATSNRTTDSDADLLLPNAFPGSGAGPGSDNYAAAFGWADSLDPTNISELERLPHFQLPDDRQISGAQFTNTTYTAQSVLNGDAFAKKFGGETGDDPDFFRLRVFGSSDGQPLGESIELYLADYRFEDNSLDFLLDEWSFVDLSPLSAADRIYFNLESSDVGEFGMNTPAFFAIDDIVLVPGTILGGVAEDGIVSLADLDAVCAGVSTASQEESLDLTGDGVVSNEDVAAALSIANRTVGDTNLDGFVDFTDFLKLASNVGTEASWSRGDFNCDGSVAFDDFLALAENFDSSPAIAAIPEPSAIMTITVGSALISLRRKRRTAPSLRGF